MPLTDVYLALGSNLGDRLFNLRQAIARLEARDAILVTRSSRIYENRAVGMGDADPFYNAVIEAKTPLAPFDLLEACLAVEDELGRKRAGCWVPRTIDIDLIFYGSEKMDTEKLKLPHPGIRVRDFVLKPLVDIDPEISLGECSAGEALEALPEVELRVVDQRCWPRADVNLIAAIAENGVIGVDGHLPWSLSEDWEVFLKKTQGGILIMGRISFEGMQREPTWKDDREYVVVTSQPDRVDFENAQTSQTISEALSKAGGSGRPVWICGGEKIYAESLAEVGQLHLTELSQAFSGDTYFPDYDSIFTKQSSCVLSSEGNYHYQFKLFEKE